MIKTKDISVLDPVGPSTWDYRPAEVRWCMQIGAGDARRYGCGAQYISEI